MLKPSNDELYHFGVKGQKRGIRQYQNLDGTWTELGKERRRKGTGYIQGIDNDENKVYNKKGLNMSPETLSSIKSAVIGAATVLGGIALLSYLQDGPLSKQAAADLLLVGEYSINSKFKSKITDFAKDNFMGSDFKFKNKPTDILQDVKAANCKAIGTEGYQDNCACSSIAHYLRRNGLDVVAKPLKGGLKPEEMDNVFPGFFNRYMNQDSIKNVEFNSYCGQDNEKYLKLLAKRIVNESSDDTFGFVSTNGLSRHWFTWEKHGNDVIFTDPQRGKIINKNDSLLNEITSKATYIDGFIRVDDLDINVDALGNYIENL